VSRITSTVAIALQLITARSIPVIASSMIVLIGEGRCLPSCFHLIGPSNIDLIMLVGVDLQFTDRPLPYIYVITSMVSV
jgi:hypothetical protein